MKSSRYNSGYNILQHSILEVSELVDDTKSNYYDMLTNKLSNLSTSSKTNWSIEKNIL